MVRIMIKGGVWKNTEDEILKAAVMKYGKSQWARVASLMSRKSAKQCKARWYEWLDPSIKKTDWTREEEEKLLHLAKLMPQQWRTIAPLVGRTAAQCLEHYERLLSTAEEAAAADAAGEGGAAAVPAAGGADDPRRLRPGEIDPNPESKPARPDPVDMDEDEKEMLSEARARLSNTKGKKAKRKAREKQLEEARRLASLQKRRELKAAGIDLERRRRWRRDIDLGREIPFHKTAPAGFYDVSEERAATKRAKLEGAADVHFLHELEEKRRDREEEANKRKDAKKIKKLMQQNLPQAVMAVSQANDPLTVRRRVPLNLPAPQMSDAEYEAVVRHQGEPGSAAGGVLALPAPVRTPAAASGEDIVMQEARNLARLVAGQTPLLGGDRIELAGGTGFEGATPKSSRIMTPHAMSATPGGAGGVGGGETPMRTPGSVRGGGGGSIAGGLKATPLRDELGLNTAAGHMTPAMSSVSSAMSVREEKARQRQHRSELAAKLAGLPEPQWEVTPLVGDDADATAGDEEGRSAMEIEEDAADRDRRLAELRRAEEEAEYRARSAVVRRGLPRPAPAAAAGLAAAMAVAAGEDAVAQAEAMVLAEMAAMVKTDARNFPAEVAAEASAGGVTRKKKKRRRSGPENEGPVPLLPRFPEEGLTAAKLLIAEEADDLAAADAAALAAGGVAALAAAWQPTYDSWVYVPSRESYALAAELNKEELLEAARQQFGGLRAQLEAAGAKAAKLEARVALKHGGYEDRAASLAERLAVAHGELDTASIERSCFDMLRSREETAVPRRLAEVENAAAEEEAAEAKLQRRYGELLQRREELKALLAAAPAAAAAEKATKGTAVAAESGAAAAVVTEEAKVQEVPA